MHTCLAAPGLVDGGRVRGAHQLSWLDTDGWAELGFRGQPDVSMNDAEASALGEWLLGDGRETDLVYVGLGTGVGSARVTDGELVPFEFGHRPGYGPRICPGCAGTCVNGQIGGEILPAPLTGEALDLVEIVLTAALRDSSLPPATTVILGGGMTRAYPALVARLRARAGLRVEPTRAAELKSAASVAMFDRAVSGSSGRQG